MDGAEPNHAVARLGQLSSPDAISVSFFRNSENPFDDVFVTFRTIWHSFFSKSGIFLTILLVPHQKVKHLKIICLVHFPFLCHKIV